ncbi:MAG: NAD-dependent epimerase [Patescibacteria group bacterium]
MKTYLVTGTAGFIGFHVARKLLDRGAAVLGLDDLNDYYDVSLKEARLALLAHPNFRFVKLDLADRVGMACLFETETFDAVIHLAAQAGVRYSLKNPHAYVDSNLVGFVNVLEGCRHAKVPHLVYASSSSVYGANTESPFSVEHRVDHPISLYAATKKANELMAHTYSYLYALSTTGLRFFTVYGPWGRPDMALFGFTKAILEGRPIDVYNHGKMKRDFTYIDDIVEGVLRAADRIPEPCETGARYKVYNIGNDRPVELESFIGTLERALGVKAVKNYLPMQPGDVPATHADVTDLTRDTGFRPSTSLDSGIARFVAWYRDFYRIPHAVEKTADIRQIEAA